jgi:hypothetical protein
MVGVKNMKRQCFCCEKTIKTEHDSPLHATAWETNGSYGSHIFDPIREEYIEIYVCDDCLRKKAKLAVHFKIKRTKERFDVKKFNIKLKKDDLAKKWFNKQYHNPC